jgi:D-alanine-D-alanine ligase
MMKTKVVVLYGGQSAEHEVSLQSALAVINGLNKDRYVVYPVYISKRGIWTVSAPVTEELADVRQLQAESGRRDRSVANSLAHVLGQLEEHRQTVFFPVLHGPYGEDGTVQGLLELLQVPYVGNGVLASALSIDKAMTKEVLSRAYIPQAEHLTFTEEAWLADESAGLRQVKEQIDVPCYVKPARLGSSVGISRCGTVTELREAIANAFRYDHKIVIEKEIIGREMQVAVLGNTEPRASVVGEYIKERPFMDYKAKYVDGKLVPVIPAKLEDDIQQIMREMAVRAFKALEATGLLRVDFFVTARNEVFLNEVNTLPGFTKYSMFPALWQKTDGTTYPKLLDRLIALALERHKRKQNIHVDEVSK